MPLRPRVRAALQQHGLEPGPEDTAAELRARLNEIYLGEVRALRERQRAGTVALRDYAAAVAALRERFPLLGLPLGQWDDPTGVPRL